MKSYGAGYKTSHSWSPQRSPRHLSVAEPHLCDMIEIVVVSARRAHPASNVAQNTPGQGHMSEEVEQGGVVVTLA